MNDNNNPYGDRPPSQENVLGHGREQLAWGMNRHARR
jgi:hypothetical protein